MRKFIYPVLAAVLMVGSAFTIKLSQDWKVNDDYTIKFTSKDPSGVFSGLKGTVIFDDKDLATSKFDVTVDASTINTGNGMKNTHAKSEKWFDTDKFTLIKFISKEITASGAGYQVKGTLEIHGVAKEVSLPFAFQKTDTGGLFTSSFPINRLDYNINTAEPDHGASVLTVDLSIPVTKP